MIANYDAMEHTPEILEAMKQAEAKGDKGYTIAFAVLVDEGDVEGYSFSVMAPSPENAVIVGTHNAMQHYKQRMLDIVAVAVYEGIHKPVQFTIPANDVGLMKPEGTA